jgi:hypothetical protein
VHLALEPFATTQPHGQRQSQSQLSCATRLNLIPVDLVSGVEQVSVERAEKDLSRAKSDVARLEAQLTDARSRATKLEHYIEMARLYDAASSDGGAKPNRVTPKPNATTVAIEILRREGKPLHTHVLLDELAKQGIHISGINPPGNLASTLSRSDLLESSRVEGWRLVEWKDDRPVTPWGEPKEDPYSHLEANREPAATTEERPSAQSSATDLDDEIPF